MSADLLEFFQRPNPRGYKPGAKRLGSVGAAKYLGVSAATLSSHRKRGTAPASYLHEGYLAYDVEELDRWAEERGRITMGANA